ncbi:MAG: hypothetical protein UW16_C0038G0002 [Microgenomates group bacterium GW2011_GWC1_44_10]|nr:MAG: hypothetical protein UW16_C0038G0002 [Microgenomates group bacterium GW2011_GWC1_44_10]
MKYTISSTYGRQVARFAMTGVGEGEIVGEGDGAFASGGGGLPEADLGEAVVCLDCRAIARNDGGRGGEDGVGEGWKREGVTGKEDVLGLKREVEAKIGDVVASVMNGRVGVGCRGGVGEVDGDLVVDNRGIH